MPSQWGRFIVMQASCASPRSGFSFGIGGNSAVTFNPLAHPTMPNLQQQTVRLHLKVLVDPTSFSLTEMVDSMRQVYQANGIRVDVASTERLTLPAFEDIEVGRCVRGEVTSEQEQLFANRNNAGPNDVCVYMVRSTVPAYNGCAAHPAERPAAVVVSTASTWTLGHEVGHVLGLHHVNNNNSLMTGNGTFNIINPPPDLSGLEISTMLASPFTQ